MGTEGKIYLGDGVYASYDGYHIVLEVNAATKVFIDMYTWLALVQYVDSIWRSASKESEEENE